MPNINTIVLQDPDTDETLYPVTHRDVVEGLDPDTPVTSVPSGGFLPNTVYDLGELAENTAFSLAAQVAGKVNWYYWTFSIGTTVPTITMPQSGITAWVGGSAPTIAANTYYEIFVRNGVASFITV